MNTFEGSLEGGPEASAEHLDDLLNELAQLLVPVELQRNLRALYIQVQHGYTDTDGMYHPPFLDIDGSKLSDEARERMVLTSYTVREGHSDRVNNAVTMLSKYPQNDGDLSWREQAREMAWANILEAHPTIRVAEDEAYEMAENPDPPLWEPRRHDRS